VSGPARVIPIARHDGLFLDCRDPAPDGPAEHSGDVHLAACFARVWERIPVATRSGMLCHWHTLWAGEQVRTRRRQCGPRIEAPADWPGQYDPRSGVRVYGELLPPGDHLRFWSVATNEMPPDLLGWLVAHELGHVEHAVRGVRFKDLDEKEAFADARADEWLGWSGREAVHAWIAESFEPWFAQRFGWRLWAADVVT
jgi:hypothetical protein